MNILIPRATIKAVVEGIADRLRQFRIDDTSLFGKHSPDVPHFHLEIFEQGIKESVVNNHNIIME